MESGSKCHPRQHTHTPSLFATYNNIGGETTPEVEGGPAAAIAAKLGMRLPKAPGGGGGAYIGTFEEAATAVSMAFANADGNEKLGDMTLWAAAEPAALPRPSAPFDSDWMAFISGVRYWYAMRSIEGTRMMGLRCWRM